MVNKVLIIALNENWTGISRLPEGLKRAGFIAFALCPQKSYLSKTQHLEDAIFYPTLTYSRSKLIYLWIMVALVYFKPQFVFPGDEDAILALQKLSGFFEKVPFLSKWSHLIRKSLAHKEYDKVVLNKSKFQELCRELGLRTPVNTVVKSKQEALLAGQRTGFPVVLKYDSGYGGSGVFICADEAELIKNYDQFTGGTLLDKFKKLVKKSLFVSVLGAGENISIQQYIEGQIGQAPFCALNGTVFAYNPMIRLQTYPGKTGPATVSTGYQNIDTEKFVRAVAKKLNFNGLGSLEYMIEESSGLLYIIELNPRPTPTCHISDKVVPNDLCLHLFMGLNGLEPKENAFKPFTIAMFPGEKRRDPNSSYFTNAYHDIPLNDPILLKALDN